MACQITLGCHTPRSSENGNHSEVKFQNPHNTRKCVDGSRHLTIADEETAAIVQSVDIKIYYIPKSVLYCSKQLFDRLLGLSWKSECGKMKSYLMVLSELPLTTSLSLYCRQAIPRLCPFSVRTNSQEEVFHTLMVRSPEADTMYFSSKSTTFTAALCPTRTLRRLISPAETISHTAIDRSYEHKQGVSEILFHSWFAQRVISLLYITYNERYITYHPKPSDIRLTQSSPSARRHRDDSEQNKPTEVSNSRTTLFVWQNFYKI